VPAGTHDPLREEFAHANAQADNRWAGKHPAFPARWVDGLCLLSPEPNSFWPPSPPRKPMHTSGWPMHLRESLAVATTARTTWFSRTRLLRSSHGEGPHEGHPALVPPCRARRSRVHRTPAHVRCDVRSPLSSGRDGGNMPQFRISV